MGTIYYNLGYLSSDEVIECSPVDLIGEFVGQTRPKTRAKLEMAVGKVLLVDDAFQLLKGPYAMEALQELVTCLASEKYAHKMVVILAGYTEEMKFLVKACGPLASLFPNEVFFKDMKVKDCLRLLERELNEINVTAPFLKEESSDRYKKLSKLMKALSLGPSWGNARDIKSLAKTMKSKLFKGYFEANRDQVLSSQTQLQATPSTSATQTASLPDLSAEQAISCVKEMILQRRRCMTPKAPPFDPEPEFSDDDPRFARALAHAHAPVLSIHIQLGQAPTPHLRDNRSIIDELTASDDTVQPRTRAIQATITLTGSMGGGFRPHMPSAFGYSMSAGFGLPIHASEDLIFEKPSDAYEKAYREIEEIVDDGEEERPDGTNQPEVPTPLIGPEQNLPENSANDTGNERITSDEAQFRSPSQAPTAVDKATEQKTKSAKTAADTAKKTKARRKFAEQVNEITQLVLKNMGHCPQGYAWSRVFVGDYGRHVCEGGCHFVYDQDLNEYMDSKGYE